jgi:hypothetical protein
MALAVAFLLCDPETSTSRGIKNILPFAFWDSMPIFTAQILQETTNSVALSKSQAVITTKKALDYVYTFPV